VSLRKPDQATNQPRVITQGLTAAAATDSNAEAEAILEAVRRLLEPTPISAPRISR
jgi:hypothetical protein